MAVQILKTQADIKVARRRLKSRKASELTSFSTAVLHRLGVSKRPPVGAFNKSWDILKTLELLEHEVSPDRSILDLGAWSSEILPVLHRIGYKHLTGIDLDARLPRMPHADSIRYVVGDFYNHSGLEPGSFGAITAISAIEHGLDLDATTDYWSTPLDTSGLRPFGLPWNVFDPDSLRALIRNAKSNGLDPVGEIALDTNETTLHWLGFRYTAAWIALRRAT
jgi:hypothetical protein